VPPKLWAHLWSLSPSPSCRAVTEDTGQAENPTPSPWCLARRTPPLRGISAVAEQCEKWLQCRQNALTLLPLFRGDARWQAAVPWKWQMAVPDSTSVPLMSGSCSCRCLTVPVSLLPPTPLSLRQSALQPKAVHILYLLGAEGIRSIYPVCVRSPVGTGAQQDDGNVGTPRVVSFS
jgi:hypothetical protein